MKKGPGKSPADKKPEQPSGEEPAVQGTRQAVEETLDAEKAKEIKKFLEMALRYYKDCGRKDLDWSTHERGEETVKQIFLRNLREGYTVLVKIFQDGLGKWMDFTGFEGYEEAAREGFLTCIKTGWIDRAIEICNQWGRGIDMSEQIKEGLVLNLRRGLAEQALEIRDQMGRGIDEILQLRNDLGEGINFREHPDYTPVISQWFKEVVDPEIANFLSSSGRVPTPEESMFAEYDEASDNEELFLNFEACMTYVTDHFRRKIQNKIKELGSPTGDPAELSEQDQAKLQALVANLHTELSAKIRAIASPELISAYLAQNAGATSSEFLTLAA